MDAEIDIEKQIMDRTCKTLTINGVPSPFFYEFKQYADEEFNGNYYATIKMLWNVKKIIDSIEKDTKVKE